MGILLVWPGSKLGHHHHHHRDHHPQDTRLRARKIHLVQTQLQPDGILSVGSTSKLTLTLRVPTKHDIKNAGDLWTPTIHPFSYVSTRQESASLLGAREITPDREEFRTTTRIENTNLSTHRGPRHSGYYRWGSTRKGKYIACTPVEQSPTSLV